MSRQELIQKESSLDFVFKRPNNLSIEGWVCTMFVKNYASDTPFITRDIPPVNGVFAGFLTSSETGSLAPGDYFLAAQLYNASTDQQEMIREQSRFKVSQDWLT